MENKIEIGVFLTTKDPGTVSQFRDGKKMLSVLMLKDGGQYYAYKNDGFVIFGLEGELRERHGLAHVKDVTVLAGQNGRFEMFHTVRTRSYTGKTKGHYFPNYLEMMFPPKQPVRVYFM